MAIPLNNPFAAIFVPMFRRMSAFTLLDFTDEGLRTLRTLGDLNFPTRLSFDVSTIEGFDFLIRIKGQLDLPHIEQSSLFTRDCVFVKIVFNFLSRTKGQSNFPHTKHLSSLPGDAVSTDPGSIFAGEGFLGCIL